MSCKQASLLQRLAVEHPAALETPGWQEHLKECEECRHERFALARSLAVFRQFESRVPPSVTGPSWEQVSRALVRSRRRRSPRLRIPLAAASLLVAVSSGVLLWPVTQGPELPSPAKIVTLQPEQQLQLRDVLHSSLQAPLAATDVGLAEPVRSEAPGPMALDVPQDASARPEVTYVDDPLGSTPAPTLSDPELTDSYGSERAPVLLFRSLQQRRGYPAPMQAMPQFSPLRNEDSSARTLLTPHSIR